MNKFYLIVPGTLLGVFLFFYNVALKDMKAKDDAHLAAIAQSKAADEARKKVLEATAEADAKKHQEERDAQEQAKAAKKKKEYDDIITTLRDDIAKNTSSADKYAKETADLELLINSQRNQKEKLNTDSFELTKQVEKAKIDRRTAELEIQRMIEMVAKKVGESSLANIPPPPPLPAK